VMGLFTQDWELVWEAPEVIGTGDLMEAVQYQVADVDLFMDTILKEED